MQAHLAGFLSLVEESWIAFPAPSFSLTKIWPLESINIRRNKQVDVKHFSPKPCNNQPSILAAGLVPSDCNYWREGSFVICDQWIFNLEFA